MKKILSLKQAQKISQNLKSQGKTLVLVGGCFDILHLGHIKFLEKAKKAGDSLFIALESDNNVKRRKGEDRPINSQKERAGILASLRPVDYVILLPDMRGFDAYFDLVKKIGPNLIAVTQNDYHLKEKRQQAQKIGAKVLVVTPFLKTNSTTKIAQILEKEF